MLIYVKIDIDTFDLYL